MKLKLFFLPIAIVIAISAFIWFIKPSWDQNSKDKKALAKERATLQELIDKSNSLEKASAQYQGLDSKVGLIETAFPKNAGNDKLVAELNDKAGDAGVFLSKINMDEIKMKASKKPTQAKSDKVEDEKGSSSSDEETIVRVEIKLDVSGDYVKLRDFIALLGKTNRFISVSSASFARSISEDSGADSGMVSGTIVCQAFYKPMNEMMAVADLIFSKDRTMNNLLSGKISTNVIDDFELSRTSQTYSLIMGSSQSGKENIFLGNTAPIVSVSNEVQ